MSIIVNNLSYTLPDGRELFSGLNLSLHDGVKASVVGDNGSGKSTLLAILAGRLKASGGEVSVNGSLYFVPQHFGQFDGMTVAEALGIDGKLAAIERIIAGDMSEDNYNMLGDDWGIEERSLAALAKWDASHIGLGRDMAGMSGGEKTKVFLAGIEIHEPVNILMDEPTNHLDTSARNKLYAFIARSGATMIIVSHDRTLLNTLDTTYELTAKGVERFGGNYDFYREQTDIRRDALERRIEESDKAIRAASRKARHVIEQKERSDSRAPAKQHKERTLPGLINKMRGKSEESMARLRQAHDEKISTLKDERSELKGSLVRQADIRIALDDSLLHTGKILFEAEEINFAYRKDEYLWKEPLSFIIRSGDRIAISGPNGSGKSTLLQIILGSLEPHKGTVKRVPASHIYVDQEYSLVDNGLTVLEQLVRYNKRNLPDHILKTELHRFLFPAETWDKPCGVLSGGEKMKLILCCLLISNDNPDMFILDEPTNNLDIRSMDIITAALSDYKGTVLVISHDRYFLNDIGITEEICL